MSALTNVRPVTEKDLFSDSAPTPTPPTAPQTDNQDASLEMFTPSVRSKHRFTYSSVAHSMNMPRWMVKFMVCKQLAHAGTSGIPSVFLMGFDDCDKAALATDKAMRVEAVRMGLIESVEASEKEDEEYYHKLYMPRAYFRGRLSWREFVEKGGIHLEPLDYSDEEGANVDGIELKAVKRKLLGIVPDGETETQSDQYTLGWHPAVHKLTEYTLVMYEATGQARLSLQPGAGFAHTPVVPLYNTKSVYTMCPELQTLCESLLQRMDLNDEGLAAMKRYKWFRQRGHAWTKFDFGSCMYMIKCCNKKKQPTTEERTWMQMIETAKDHHLDLCLCRYGYPCTAEDDRHYYTFKKQEE